MGRVLLLAPMMLAFCFGQTYKPGQIHGSCVNKFVHKKVLFTLNVLSGGGFHVDSDTSNAILKMAKNSPINGSFISSDWLLRTDLDLAILDGTRAIFLMSHDGRFVYDHHVGQFSPSDKMRVFAILDNVPLVTG